MTPPMVLLERTFLVALVDSSDVDHDGASRRYDELIDAYERAEVALGARLDHIEAVDPSVRRSLLAPVSTIHVAAQHHRQATRLTLPFEADHDVEVTLVIMRRERITDIATFDPVFDSVRPVQRL
jgi:predicted nucleic acid-binding protein